jgi:hypothetical protein
MLGIVVALVAALACATIWPDLPFGRATALLGVKAVLALQSTGLQARAVLAIVAALLLYAAIWSLAGDAPMFLAMVLPELAVWFTTFEIATLAEAMVAVGTSFVALRAAGAGRYFKAKSAARSRRARRSVQKGGATNDDDGPADFRLAA